MNEYIRDVYHIVEKEAEGNEPAKAIWTKIGVAFVNRDQSLNVIMDMLPLNGKLHIRDRRFNKNQSKFQKGDNV